MEDLDLFSQLEAIEDPFVETVVPINSERHKLIVAHKTWLATIRHEKPSTTKHLRVAVYIRFFNQTKYDDYLEHHKKQFADTLKL